MKASTLSSAIDEQYKFNNPQTNRKHIGISSIGNQCDRALWYMFRNAKTPCFDGRMLRLFQYGHDAEHGLSKLLESVGFRVYNENPTTKQQWHVQDPNNYFFSGSLDTVAVSPSDVKFDGVKPDTPYIVDYKTCSNSSFKQFLKKGLIDWKIGYYAQLQCYMGFSGQLGRGEVKDALLMAINKDNHELHIETIEFNQSFFDAMRMKAEMIVVSEKPPVKLDEKSMNCRFCDFKGICHGEDLPEPSCRLCGFHKVSLERGEKCEKGYKLQSCVDHMYNPYVFDGDFVPITFTGDAMEYDAFINCSPKHKSTGDKPKLTSKEIYEVYMNKDQEMIDTLLQFARRYGSLIDVD